MREIEDAMPATELTEWSVFYQQHPFGEYRADLRAGIIASTIAAAHGNKNANPLQFMPVVSTENALLGDSGPSPRAREAAQVTNALMQASSRLKHYVIRRKKKG